MWLLLSWVLHKWKREFSDTNFEIRKKNLADISNECFSNHQGERLTEAFSQNVSKVFFSDLKFGTREFSFLFPPDVFQPTTLFPAPLT